MSAEAILEININQTETFGIALRPFKIIQQWPCEVSSNICTVSVDGSNHSLVLYAQNKHMDETRN